MAQLKGGTTIGGSIAYHGTNANISSVDWNAKDLTLGNSDSNQGCLNLWGYEGDLSTIKATTDNLHIDAAGAGNLYLNYYTGTGGVLFGNGASGSNANVSAAGVFNGTCFIGTCFCGKAFDSDRLDNINSGSFLRSDASDIKTSGYLRFNDNICANFGSSDDLKIYHNASNSYIDNITGNLNIRVAGTENAIAAVPNSCVQLYFDNSAKLKTMTGGVCVTGYNCATTCHRSPVICATTCFKGSGAGLTGTAASLTAGNATKLTSINTTFTGTYPMTVNVTGAIYSHTNVTYNGTSGALTATCFVGTCFCGKAYDADRLDGVHCASFLRSDASDIKTSGYLRFNDNICANFGSSDDLKIYHNASNSYINNTGTGALYIQDASVNGIIVASTCVRLYNTGNIKFTTLTTGTCTTGTHCSSTCSRSPYHYSSTCACSPVVCATTRAQSPIVCGSTCVKGGYLYSTGNMYAATLACSATVCGTLCVKGAVICATSAVRVASTGIRMCLATACGCAVDWIATSDCRIKKCIEPITSALSKVDCLCGVCYELCEDGTKDMGLIAQEVLCVEPRLVTSGEPDEMYVKKYGIEDDMLGLKYDKFAGLFVEAIKELKNQVLELKSEIKILKDEKNI